MDRRTFLAGTGAVFLAVPLAVEAQQRPVPRIGILTIGRTPRVAPLLLTAGCG